MLSIHRSHLCLAGTLLLAACGAQNEASSATKGLQPNLRFVGNTVRLLTVPGTPTVAYGGTVKVPCNTGGLRIKYKYGNGGGVAAGAHQNKGQALGSAAFTFAFAGLGSGVAREAIASVGAIVNPNVETPFAIVLDAANAVAPETSEVDNVFKAQILRVCP